MIRSDYVLTHAAEADVRAIIRHTHKEWGDPQVRRYVTKLEQGIARLAAGREPFKDMSALYPALRMLTVSTTMCFAYRVSMLRRSS